MMPRLFLDTAKRLVGINTEGNWRTAAGRAYYALVIECRDALARWGFAVPKSDALHRVVRLRFYTAHEPDLIEIGTYLGDLGRLRSKADYEMSSPFFRTDKDSKDAIIKAERGLKLLDAIDSDPARRAAAIADIKTQP